MYWLCYDDDDGPAVILYSAEAPDEYAHEYGYDTQAEAEAALDDK